MAQAPARVRFALSALFLGGAALAMGCSEAHGAETDTGSEARDGGGAPDAPLYPDGGYDAFVVDTDGGVMPGSCTPQDAQAMQCPTAICDGPDSYAWDGERCVRIDCGTCVGTDCGHLVRSQAACEAAHATCVPEMCRATGGSWLFWAAECHHYHCGEPQPAECLIGMPVCDCGVGRSFDAARGGCFDDSSCPEVDPLPPQTLCTSTGGTWMPGICCNTECGQFCPLACANDACACGPLQIFDPVRGCIDGAQCHVQPIGGECSSAIRCADGLICCSHCGGAGCGPTMNCQAPLCDADPNIDVCGNNLLAP